MFDQHVVLTMRRLLAPGGKSRCGNGKLTVVDVGANLGFMTQYAAALGCRVVAVEAQLGNMRMLEAATCLNGHQGLVTHHLGAATNQAGFSYGVDDECRMLHPAVGRLADDTGSDICPVGAQPP